MNLDTAAAPAARLISYRYMTYDELAVVLGSTPKHAHKLVRQNGWKRHTDRTGRPRASVPEAFLSMVNEAGITMRS